MGEEEMMIKPEMTEATAKAILWKLYGLKAIKVKPLIGYFDKNFFVQVDNEHNNQYFEKVLPDGYILKVTNSFHSENDEFFDAQCCMMLHLAEKGFHTPWPVKNIKGQYKKLENLQDYADEIEMTDNGAGVRNMVRLLAFIEGKIFNDLDTWTDEHFYQCGQFAARMDNALQDFHHEAYNDRTDLWYMSAVPEVKKYLNCISDSVQRNLILDIVGEFEKEIIPVLKKGNLPTAVIHGDMNEQNIVMRPISADKTGYDVYTVIDFGDSQKNPIIFEVAVVIMYMMSRGEVISPGGHVLAGYLSERQLSDEELGLLRVLVAGRFAQSLVLGTHSAKEAPENEYLLTTINNGGWKLIEEFWKVPKGVLYGEWKKIIESYK